MRLDSGMKLEVRDLGRVAYAPTLDLQRSLQRARIAAHESGAAATETLLLLEHMPVYTWGKRTKQEHMGDGPQHLKTLGADVFETHRGGEITYHGPGQLVGYPIAFLGNLRCGRDLHKYMRGLEEMMLHVLASYGLQGQRVQGLTGVWVEHAGTLAKVAALGVRVTKWVSMHGFALNVSDEVLPWFSHITPCGIKDRPVTSLQTLLGTAPTMAEVKARAEAAFREVF